MVLLLLLVLLVVLLVSLSNIRSTQDEFARRLRLVEAELARLRDAAVVGETAPSPPATAAASTPVAPPTPAPVQPPAPTNDPAPQWELPPSEPWQPAPPSATRLKLERLLAEHALSIVGGLFVLVAAIFFIGYAIDQGWIGPLARMVLAAAFGAALAALGIRVASRLEPAERQGRAVGSLHGVLAGVGAAVVFLAVIGAVRLEQLVGPAVGVALQVLVAGATVQLARRWHAPDLAAFGLVVALAAPALLDAPAGPATFALLAVALAATSLVAVVEGWPRLLPVALLVTAPQLLSVAGDASAGGAPWHAAAVAIGWWALLAGGAVAGATRAGVETRSAVATLLAAPLVVAGVATRAIDDPAALGGVLGAFAVVQAVVALALGQRAADRHLPLLVALSGAAAATAALAIAELADGAAVTIAFAAEAVALAVLWWRTRTGTAGAFAAGSATLATAHALWVAPPSLLAAEVSTVEWWPLLAIAAIAVGAVVALVLADRVGGASEAERRGLELVAATATWYACAVLLAGLPIDPEASRVVLAAWAGVASIAAGWYAAVLQRVELVVATGLALLLEAAMLVAAGSQLDLGLAVLLLLSLAAAAIAATTARSDRPEREAFIAVPVAQAAMAVTVLLVLLPPSLLRAWDGRDLVPAVGQLLAMVVAVAATAWAAGRVTGEPRARSVGWAAGALAALYALSVVVVAVSTQRPGVVEQSPQVALTLTWLVVGIAALVAGTSTQLRRHPPLRIGAYALLGVAAAKLVLVDTAQLDTPMRVLAFLATGLGLLGSAWLEQRMRIDDAR